MAFQYGDFDGFEFADRSGIIRTIYGCSTIGLFEFHDRLAAIQAALNDAPDDQTWMDLYQSDRYFAHNIQQALRLNNIEPDWVTLPMVAQLLFPRETSQGSQKSGEDSPDLLRWELGYLVALNAPRKEVAPRTGTEATTAGEVVGAIATHTESLEGAIRLAETVPAQQLQAIMGGKNKLQRMQTEEGKKQESAKKNKEKARSQLDELRKRAG